MYKKGVLTGILLFGLFFGAGNLIFPPTIGVLSGEQFIPAISGFVVSAVGFAIFTTVVGLITGKSYDALISKLVHPTFSKLFLLLLYLSIGPLFSIPRTAATSFSIGVEPILQADQKSIGLLIFSVVYFVLTYWLSVTPTKLLDRVGKILTPLFAGMIILVIVLGLLKLPNMAMNVTATTYQTTSSAFGAGLLEGYNTLDALAAVAFGVVAMNTLVTFGFKSRKEYKQTVFVSAISISVLFSVLYIGLALLGNHFTMPDNFKGNIGTYILSEMTQRVFGQPGQLFLAVMVIVTCMTTTVGLVVSISEFFNKLYSKLSYQFYVRLFSVLGVVVANFGLDAIIKFAVPVLLLLYPITIVIATIVFLHQLVSLSKVGVRLTMVIVTVIALMQAVSDVFGVESIKSLLNVLPFNDVSMPWILPTLVGLVLAFILPYGKLQKLDVQGE